MKPTAILLIWSALAPLAFGDDGGVPPPLPPPVIGDAFRGVRDRTPITFRETAAYAELLLRARRTSSDDSGADWRTDVLFADLVTNPTRYRGVPIRLQGTARLVHTLHDVPEALAADGRLYEAWVYTTDGRGFPTVLVTERLPDGLPVGDDLNALVVFHGTFFKLMAYQAGDRSRFAPLLVGRLEYLPQASPGAKPFKGTSGSWVALPVAILGTYALLRIILVWQRGFSPSPRTRHYGSPPNEKITPEELDAWLKGQPADPSSGSSETDDDSLHP